MLLGCLLEWRTNELQKADPLGLPLKPLAHSERRVVFSLAIAGR